MWFAGFVLMSIAGVASDSVAERLRTRLEVPASLQSVEGEPILALQTLEQFYAERLFQPVWTDGAKALPLADRLLGAVRQSSQDGLPSEHYHARAIEARLRESRAAGRNESPASNLVDLELLLTDAFLLYASHIAVGRVDPTTFDSEWFVPPARRRDILEALNRAVRGGDIGGTLAALRPADPGYARLQEALATYREKASAVETLEIPEGPKLVLDVEDPRVSLVRHRLVALGDLEHAAPNEATRFNADLEQAVKRFQRRHGLEPDGAVGPATTAALNVPLTDRVRQIELSLERWRWLPDDLGARHILVNIPSFELQVVESGETVLEMNVVVGKPFRRTPVFSASMTYLVLSPYWHVPPTIARLDVVPALVQDPEYLAKKNMKVFHGWGAETEAIDPSTIDWSQVDRNRLPYRFRQDPGPLNALGGVKFMFPNPHHIYLHDTPSRELFNRPDRTFSSGCIRIQRPIDLALYLLRGDGTWTAETLRETIQKGEERTVRLSEPIEVHLQYWTSWVDADGVVHFRKDVYNRDALLAQAMAEAPVAVAVDPGGAR